MPIGSQHFALDNGEVDTWFNQEACTGRGTRMALGQSAVSRRAAAWPRRELSLSTTQNTRAEAEGSVDMTSTKSRFPKGFPSQQRA
jgi:hypothetical protein